MPVIEPHLETDEKPDGMNANLAEERIGLVRRLLHDDVRKTIGTTEYNHENHQRAVRSLNFRVKLLNVYQTPKIVESVTPGTVTCVNSVVNRWRDRLIGVTYQLRRTNRYTSIKDVKTPPSHVTSLMPFDWSEVILEVVRTKETIGDELYSQ
jgi:hypothetical protein